MVIFDNLKKWLVTSPGSFCFSQEFPQKIELNFLSIFDNLLLIYPILFLECVGYISSYLPSSQCAQWVSTCIPDPKIPNLNPTDVLGWALRPNLVMRLSVTVRSNKIKRNDYVS